MSQLFALIDRFIPENLRQEPGDMIRAQFLVSFAFLLSSLGIFYNVPYFRVGNYIGGAAIILTGLSLFWLPWHLKRHGDLVQSINLAGAMVIGMNGAITFTSGGSSYSGNPWWALTPVIVTLVAGGRYGLRWTYLVVAIFVGMYTAERLGFQFPNYIDPNNQFPDWVHFLDWFHFVGIVFVMVAATLVFNYINMQIFKAEKETRRQVEENRQAVEEYSQYLDRNVNNLLEEIEKLAGGDLTLSMDPEREDAVGKLVVSLNTAAQRMHRAVSEVAEAVHITTGSSQKIKSATAKLNSEAVDQNDKTGEIAASTSQIVALIAENAHNARSTAETAAQNGALAEEGGQVVRKTVDKMEEIAGVVRNTTTSIEALGGATRQIGNIVSVISDIAERTNLLALNASIEAAHAGQMGAGFGVIAEEVKQLAGRTAEETGRIESMIKEVQIKASAAVDGMKTGNQQVAEGKQLAEQAGSALERIVDSSDNVRALIQQIALACEQQTEQSEYLFNQIEELKNTTEASAEEITKIAGSTEDLGGLTGELQGLLERFKL